MERATVGLREVKFDPGAGAMTFNGYGAVFGNVDSYGDVIQPGAFADTLAGTHKSGRWPAMLLQHGGWGAGADDMTPIGIWTSMSEDGHGLKVEGKLADTTRGREAYALLKMDPRPAIDGLSIGYIAKEWAARSTPEEPRRTLKKVDLMEVSLVTFPANRQARITGVKSIGTTEREIEEWLVRDAGLTTREAKTAISHGFKALLGARDATGEMQELTEALKRRAVFG